MIRGAPGHPVLFSGAQNSQFPRLIREPLSLWGHPLCIVVCRDDVPKIQSPKIPDSSGRVKCTPETARPETSSIRRFMSGVIAYTLEQDSIS
jgi:hypothetical protein